MKYRACRMRPPPVLNSPKRAVQRDELRVTSARHMARLRIPSAEGGASRGHRLRDESGTRGLAAQARAPADRPGCTPRCSALANARPGCHTPLADERFGDSVAPTHDPEGGSP